MNPRQYLNGPVTCVLAKDGHVLTSTRSGIAPIMQWIADGTDLRGYSAADRIVGKAAAMLFVRSGICSVYGEVMSEAGKRFLDAHGIPNSCGTLTEYIINRNGDGPCPMERTVLSIDDVDEAYEALKRKLAELRAGK